VDKHIEQPIDFLLAGQSQAALECDTALLKKAGYSEIETVEDGGAARDLLRGRRVHFIIAELEMPHMNGIELLRFVRRSPALLDIPVLLTSDEKNKEMVVYAQEEMVDGYLASPYSGEDLLCSILRIQLKKKNKTPLQKEILRARFLFLQRKYDEAMDAAKEILSHEQDEPQALLILSESLYRTRDMERARKILDLVLKRNSGNAKAMHLLSKICRLDADCGKSFTYLAKALKHNPRNIDLKIDLGKFYLDTGMEEKAHEVFESVLNSKPTDLNLIKVGKALLKKDDLQEAGRFLNKTTRPLPETAYIFKNFGDKLVKAEQIEDSVFQYRKCMAMDPENGDYVLFLAKALVQMGQKEEGKTVLRDYLEDYPRHQETATLLKSLETEVVSVEETEGVSTGE